MSVSRMLGVIGLGALAIGAAPPDPKAPFETLRLSATLAREARTRHDAVLMLAAARLRRSVPVQADADADRTTQWIDEAERMGSADPRIASLVDDMRTEATKGRAAGPRVAASLIRAGQQRSFVERFSAGRPAVVYVEGDGDSDLALAVGGPDGVACHDATPGDVKICAWLSRGAGPIRVEVTNVGAVENRFILGTN